MRLLLDTQILLWLTNGTLASRHPQASRLLADERAIAHASVASLWEIAIKTRLGKLDPGMPLADLAGYFQAIGLVIIPIEWRHAVAGVDPEPPIRDPFDRMLLAQCAVEGLQLLTADRALAAHALAMRLA